MPRFRPRWATAPLLLLCPVLALPVLALAASWLGWNAQSADVLRHMQDTVLPEYARTSLLLCVAVALSVAVVGMATACAVTLFDFPLRRTAEWALLLPLAMPAYVVAYAYTDFFQFSGPLQNWLRSSLGLQGRVFPEVRSLGGAVWVFTFSLYPYVYLLARSALSERASHLMEAARLLGAPMWRRVREVALPLARPAVAAGIALALMETLADVRRGQLLWHPNLHDGHLQSLAGDGQPPGGRPTRHPVAGHGRRAGVAGAARAEAPALCHHQRPRPWQPRCPAPGAARRRPLAGLGGVWRSGAGGLLLLPVLFMLRPLAAGWTDLPWTAFWRWSLNSLWLAGLGAALATSAAWWLAFVQRRQPGALTTGAVQLVGLGYAVPGAVLVVGLLLPVGWVQAAAPAASVGYRVTATVMGLLWAYLVRFTAVALQVTAKRLRPHPRVAR